MRRKDREVTGLENILAILDKCEVMRIGLCADNRPYIVPMNFGMEAVDEEKVYIYFHGAPEGRKMDMIARNNHVCFEVDCSYKTVGGKTACNWSAVFESVIGEGTIEILSEEKSKIHALDVLMKKYGFQGKPYYDQHALAAVAVLRITVDSLTGKRKQ